jgi:syringomycin synthetase protein SyrE
VIEEARTRFDLVQGPLARGRLIRHADDDHTLLLTLHHLVSDGWSTAVPVREFGALYAGASLPPLEVQYAGYAAWQRRWLHGDLLRDQAEFWKATLAGAPAVHGVPTDRPRPARQDYAGDYVTFRVDEGLTVRTSTAKKSIAAMTPK